MIKIEDLKELIFDLALEEYHIREKDELGRNSTYVVFNFLQSIQIRILLKYRFNLPMTDKEKKIKDN